MTKIIVQAGGWVFIFIIDWKAELASKKPWCSKENGSVGRDKKHVFTPAITNTDY